MGEVRGHSSPGGQPRLSTIRQNGVDFICFIPSAAVSPPFSTYIMRIPDQSGWADRV